MAFRKFRYHPDAEPGLKAIFARGDETVEELRGTIRKVQRDWSPDDQSIFIVPFYDFFLVFTVSAEDPALLVLAAVQQ